MSEFDSVNQKRSFKEHEGKFNQIKLTIDIKNKRMGKQQLRNNYINHRVTKINKYLDAYTHTHKKLVI